MTQMNEESTANVDFQIHWSSEHAAHEENMHVECVHFWRDLIPEKIKEGLLNRPMGSWAGARLAPGQALPNREPAQVKTLKASQVRNGHGVKKLRSGRFHPRGILRDVGNVFPQNMTPFRVLEAGGGKIVADFNHPMAGRPLELRARIAGNLKLKEERGGGCQAVEDILGVGPGMQARANGAPTDFFTPGAFDREDNGEDRLFYAKPRMVNHLDAKAMEMVRGVYANLLKNGMDVLDLMASWNSHIPEGVNLNSLHGLGMNSEELKQNPLLTGFTAADLNHDPALPFEDRSFDAVICTVSVEYLTRPRDVFREAARVLRPGGVFAAAFSNRWFRPKVVDVWKNAQEFERIGLVLEYFLDSGAFTDLHTYSMRGLPRPEDDKYADQFYCSDPVYAVWGFKAA